MRFKTSSIPKPSQGQSFEGTIDEVVPNQNMTLQEILDRFTRGEPLPVRQDVSYTGEDPNVSLDNPLHVDLEKMAVADMVDQDEFREMLNEVTSRYESQEKVRKANAAKEKAEAEEKAYREKIAAEERAKFNSEKSAQ